MKMKNLITIIFLSCAALVGTAGAQTNVPSFFQSAETFLTDFNTNYTWTNISFEASTGLKQITGQGANDIVNGQFHLKSFELGANIQFEGVGSTVGAAQGIIGYDVFQHYDAQVDIEVQPGYSWYRRAYVVEPELVIEKKMTANTFVRIGISEPIYSKGGNSRSPSFETGVGFTF